MQELNEDEAEMEVNTVGKIDPSNLETFLTTLSTVKIKISKDSVKRSFSIEGSQYEIPQRCLFSISVGKICPNHAQ